jgi:hypothetical protein
MKDELDKLDELPFETGDPSMIVKPEEVAERYGICPDCADTGVAGGYDPGTGTEAKDFCHCDEGEILKTLAFGQPVEVKIMLRSCPECGSPRARGRKYDGDLRTVFCPDCKVESVLK